jgi:hypothetical protein
LSRAGECSGGKEIELEEIEMSWHPASVAQRLMPRREAAASLGLLRLDGRLPGDRADALVKGWADGLGDKQKLNPGVGWRHG